MDQQAVHGEAGHGVDQPEPFVPRALGGQGFKSHCGEAIVLWRSRQVPNAFEFKLVAVLSIGL